MIEVDKDSEFKKRLADFNREIGRIEPYKNRRPLTTNLELRSEYKKSLVQTYNDLLIYLNNILPNATLEQRLDIVKKFCAYLNKFKEAFQILGLSYQFEKSNSALIDINKIRADTESDSEEGEDSQDDLQDTDSHGISDQSVSVQKTNNTASNSNQTENDSKMPQQAKDFIALAHQMISYRYNGDPLSLDSFLDAIALVKELCEDENLVIFRKFVMTRLEGVAREAIVTEPVTVDDIVRQLKASIKTESSKVIEGRILALRADKSSLTKFAEQAEALADQFRRSLCVEGFSKEKAKELAVEKTVEMCRKSAKNDTVKAVIAASKFSEPKEVIAKMIVEINNIKQDRPQGSYTHKFARSNQNNNNGRNNHNDRSNNFHNNLSNNRGNWRNNGNNNNNNNRNHNNGHRSNNQNGQNQNRNGQGYNNGYNRNNNSNRGTDRAEVRVISGNELHPGNSGQQEQ